MKLIKNNKTKTDCGVVAAFNAASWSGHSFTYGQTHNLAIQCGYDPGIGIYLFQFSNLLRKLKVPVKRFKPKSPAQMIQRLMLGKLLVVFYVATGENVGHVVSFFMNHEGNIKAINPELSQERRTWQNFITDIRDYGMKQFHIFEVSHNSSTVTKP